MRYHGLQALRFYAAMSVVLYHAGMLGRELLNLDTPLVRALAQPVFGSAVLLFFAVSGFVVTHSLQTAPAARFWVLRAARIYPAYWLAVGGALALKFGLWGTAGPATPGAVVYDLFLLPDAPPAGFVLGAEWTLVYEVFFYAAFGVLALVGGRRGVAVGTAVWLVAVVVALVVGDGTTGRMYPSWGEIAFSAHLLPFLAGAAVYHVRGRAAWLRPWVALALPPLLLVPHLVVSAVVIWTAQAVVCAAIVWLVAGRDWPAGTPAVRLGDASYGLYLVHVQAISILYLENRAHGWFIESDLLVLFTVGVAVAVGSAYGALEWTAYRRLRGLITSPARRPAPPQFRLAA